MRNLRTEDLGSMADTVACGQAVPKAAVNLRCKRQSDFFSGFELRKERLNGIDISHAVGGTGPAVLLSHGHPQIHIVWRKIAPGLVDAGLSGHRARSARLWRQRNAPKRRPMPKGGLPGHRACQGQAGQRPR